MLKGVLSNPDRLKRLGSHTAWTIADQVMNIGWQRLIFFPVLARMLTDDDFGGFLIALGLIQMVGVTPGNGMLAYVMRDSAKHTEADQRLLVRTAGIFTGFVTLPFAIGFVLAMPLISSAYPNSTLGLQVAVLAPFLVLTNLTETILCIQRVRRDFRYIALIHCVQSVLLFVAIPLLPIAGVLAIAIAHVIAAAATLALQVYNRRDELLEQPYFSWRFARDAFDTWWPVSLSALAYMSAGYLDRIVLGLWWPEAEVAAFFAAVSTSQIFGVPGSVLSSLIFSLLGKVAGPSAFSRKFYAVYALSTIVLSVALAILGILLGPFILKLLYPRLAEQALPLWTLSVWAAVIANLHSLTRPFVVKFFSIRWIPGLAWFGIVGRVVPLLLLAPSGGRYGAVVALFIGSTASSAAWFLVYMYKLVWRSPVAEPPPRSAAQADLPDPRE